MSQTDNIEVVIQAAVCLIKTKNISKTSCLHNAVKTVYFRWAKVNTENDPTPVIFQSERAHIMNKPIDNSNLDMSAFKRHQAIFPATCNFGCYLKSTRREIG